MATVAKILLCLAAFQAIRLFILRSDRAYLAILRGIDRVRFLPWLLVPGAYSTIVKAWDEATDRVAADLARKKATH